MKKKAICKNCGVVNEIELENLGDEGEDWLECDLPLGFEWTLPVGKISPVIGDPIYISAHGEHLSRSAYLQKYDLDPEIAYKMMRGKVVRQDTAKMLHLDRPQPVKSESRTSSRSLFEEEDWEI